MTVGLGLARWTDVPDFLGLVTPVAIQSIVETLEHWQMGCLKGDSPCGTGNQNFTAYSSHVKSHAAHTPPRRRSRPRNEKPYRIFLYNIASMALGWDQGRRVRDSSMLR